MTTTLYENNYKKDNFFSFWKNWTKFLELLDENKINSAKQCLVDFIWWENKIKDKTIVDFWCWSWLMSLCFVLLWAKHVLSIDVDDYSVSCAKNLKSKYNIDDTKWTIKTWSVLDDKFIDSLWHFDIVYSWWVIHHSWNMWKWLDLITNLVKDKWLLFIALYNKFSWFPSSNLWHKIKKFYVSSNSIIRKILYYWYIAQILTMRIVRWQNPIKYINNYDKQWWRWMDFYRDVEDWLWWFPYEYASVQEIKHYYEKKWFELINLKDSSAWIWCHEFLFIKS